MAFISRVEDVVAILMLMRHQVQSKASINRGRHVMSLKGDAALLAGTEIRGADHSYNILSNEHQVKKNSKIRKWAF
jgi:hypothetical protein